MHKVTLEALKASIRKWDANASAATPDDITTGADNCPLCVRFFMAHGSCDGCPVSKRTARPVCHGTPYYVAWGEKLAWRRAPKSDKLAISARAACAEEAEFLRSLLPEGETVE